MAKDVNVAGQQFAWETTSDVSKAMIGAGTAGRSRIAAGIVAAWRNKTKSMYSGSATTGVARILRILGKDNAAKWYDRFFAKEKVKSRKIEQSGEGVSDAKLTAQISLNTGLLKAQGLRLNAMHGLLDAVAGEVVGIKAMLMPKTVQIQGTSGKQRNVQFNPLAPAGEQFQDLSSKGALTYKKLSAKDKENASRRAALETAKIVLKVIEEDRKTAELRKKFAWKDEDEQYKVEDPLEKLNEKVDHIGEALDEMKKRGGLLSTIMSIVGAAFGTIMSFLAPAGMVAFAGMVGLAVGNWLNEHFKLSEVINNAIDKGLSKIGIGHDAAGERAVATTTKAELLAATNAKLVGTNYKLVDINKYQRSDGAEFTSETLPPEAKELMKARKVAGFQNYQPERKSNVHRRRQKRGIESYRTGAFDSGGITEEPEETGSLRIERPSTTDTKDLLDLISKGEGTSDEQAKAAGYESGYDVELAYGQYSPKHKPISKMTFAEVRLLQDAMLANQRKQGISDPSSAVGRYQMVRTNLFGNPSDKEYPYAGLMKQAGYKSSDIFSPNVQDELANLLLVRRGLNQYKSGAIDSKTFQKNLAGEWASVADPKTDLSMYGQRTGVKTADIQPVIAGLGGQIDSSSRTLVAANNPANVTVVAPQQQTNVISNPPPAPRPVQKASPYGTDPTFIRNAARDIPHPTQI